MPDTQTLTIGVRALRALVDPVIPSAASGPSALPLLASVRIASSGKWLVAEATDRFMLALHRVAAPSEGEWPVWSAVVPTSTLTAILTTYKPASRIDDPSVTLSIVDDGAALRVHGDEALLSLTEATITYPLQTGEWPHLRKIVRDALAADTSDNFAGFDPGKAARLLRGAGGTVQMRLAAANKPIVYTDGENFVGLLMTRRLIGGENSTPAFPTLADWTDLLADAKPKRKGRAA